MPRFTNIAADGQTASERSSTPSGGLRLLPRRPHNSLMGISLLVYCAALGASSLLAIRESTASAGVRLSYWKTTSKAPYSRVLSIVSWAAAGGAASALAGGAFFWFPVIFLVAVSPAIVMPALHNRRLVGPQV